MLTALLIVNGLGTIYGFYWYWDQLVYTVDHHPLWMSFLVPDSPTASLFFTAAILWLYVQRERRLSGPNTLVIRAFVEAFAVVTSVKYGIWAVVMIFAGAAQGSSLDWQNYMLVASHVGMAVQALLYSRFFRYGAGALAAVAAWTLFNDVADYGFNIHPFLPSVLDAHMDTIRTFTVVLSLFSLAAAWAFAGRPGKSAV